MEIGQKIGRLTIHSKSRVNKVYFYNCICDCGKCKVVRHCNLGKNTFSCGCLRSELAAKAALERRSRQPKVPRIRRRLHIDRIRAIYAGMINRCSNPSAVNYKYYGGKGVSVCQEWLDSFDQFVIDVGERPSSSHTLDRINSSGNYEPSNVRWATKSSQSKNRSSARFFKAFCFYMCLNDYCKVFKIPQATLWNRLNRGIPIEQALSMKRYPKKAKS